MQLAEIQHTASLAIDPSELRKLFDREGCVLLRGHDFDLATFEKLTSSFCKVFHEVGTRQSLRQRDGDGFTTEVFRDNFILLSHSEGAYRPGAPPPDVCFFMCVTPPNEAGGETTMIDGAEMLAAIPPGLRRRLEDVGVIYECLWGPERWQSEFGIDTRDELERVLAKLSDVRYTLTDGILHLFFSAAAINRSREGVSVFANGILAHLPEVSHPHYAGRAVYVNATNRMYFGDGEPFADKVVNTLIDVHDQVAHRHPWNAHDVLIIDNTRYMHGREMTARPCERVLISRFGRLRHPDW